MHKTIRALQLRFLARQLRKHGVSKALAARHEALRATQTEEASG